MSGDGGMLRFPKPQAPRRNIFFNLFGYSGGGQSHSSAKEAAAAAQAEAEERQRQEKLSRLAIPLTQTAIIFFKDMCLEHRQTFVVFPFDGSDFQEFVLGPAEEEHIAMAKEVIPELAECERAACAGEMSETALTRVQFWFVYFTLLKPFEIQQQRDSTAKEARQQIDLPHISVPQSLSMVPVNRLDGFVSCALVSPYPPGSSANTAFLLKALRKSLAAKAFMEHRLELGEKIKDDIIRHCPRNSRPKTWTYLLGCAPFNLHDPGYFDNAIKELNSRKKKQREEQQKLQEEQEKKEKEKPPEEETRYPDDPPPAVKDTKPEEAAETTKTAAAPAAAAAATTTATTTTSKKELQVPLFGAQLLFNKSDYDELVKTKDRDGLDWDKWKTVMELLAMDWGAEAPLLFLPDFISLLMYVLQDESLAYVGASLILTDSALNSTVFPMSHSSESAWMDLLESLVGVHVPRLAAHMKAIWLDVCSFASYWFERLFVGSTPLATVLRFCDCLLVDGAPAFFRLTLSLLQRFEPDLLKTRSAEDFTDKLARLMRGITEPDEIIAIAYTFPLDMNLFPANGSEHTHIMHVTESVTEANRLADQQHMQKPYIKCSSPSFFFPQSPRPGMSPAPDGYDDERFTGNPSNLMSRIQFDQLNRWLPPHYSIMEPQLIFTTTHDGFSLENMLRHVEGHSPLIMVVETTEHNVFGCFVPGQLYSKGEHFYGTGEAFLFTFAPKPIIYEWRKGRNQFFFMVHNRTIAIGGGGQGPGMWIDGELNHGRSHRSATFCNAPLNNGKTDFVILALEIFTFTGED